jgi:hypothetical protein
LDEGQRAQLADVLRSRPVRVDAEARVIEELEPPSEEG